MKHIILPNITSPLKPSEESILKQIRDHLLWDKRVSIADIQIDFTNGILTLSGVVDRNIKKTVVEKICKTIAGVDSVKNNIMVIEEMRPTDLELKYKLMEMIQLFPFVKGEKVKVEVIDGVAYLYGIVKRREAKAYVAEITWELSWVKDCKNKIEIEQDQPMVEKRTLFSEPKFFNLATGF